jgi:hypothetical protein
MSTMVCLLVMTIAIKSWIQLCHLINPVMEATTFSMDILTKHLKVGNGFIVEILKDASTLTVVVICILTLHVSMRKMALGLLRMRKGASMNTRGRV